MILTTVKEEGACISTGKVAHRTNGRQFNLTQMDAKMPQWHHCFQFGIIVCLAGLRHALALVRVQKAFAQSDRVWRDLNELVIVDIRNRLFQ